MEVHMFPLCCGAHKDPWRTGFAEEQMGRLKGKSICFGIFLQGQGNLLPTSRVIGHVQRCLQTMQLKQGDAAEFQRSRSYVTRLMVGHCWQWLPLLCLLTRRPKDFTKGLKFGWADHYAWRFKSMGAGACAHFGGNYKHNLVDKPLNCMMRLYGLRTITYSACPPMKTD